MARVRVGAASALLIATVAYGCGNDHTVLASAYNQSCSVDADCVVVVVGNVCGCGESYAAINAADVPRYRADVAGAWKGCPVDDSASCAASPPAACAQGACIVCAYAGCPPKLDAGLDASPE